MNSTTTHPAVHTATSHYRFKPFNVGRFVIWTLFAVMLIVAPMLFRGNLSTGFDSRPFGFEMKNFFHRVFGQQFDDTLAEAESIARFVPLPTQRLKPSNDAGPSSKVLN